MRLLSNELEKNNGYFFFQDVRFPSWKVNLSIESHTKPRNTINGSIHLGSISATLRLIPVGK